MKYTISILVGLVLLMFNMVYFGFPEEMTDWDKITGTFAALFIIFGCIGEFIKSAAKELRPKITVENVHKHEVRKEEETPSALGREESIGNMIENALEHTTRIMSIMEDGGCIANEKVPADVKSHYEESHCEKHKHRQCAPEPEVSEPTMPETKSQQRRKAVQKKAKVAKKVSKSSKKQ